MVNEEDLEVMLASYIPVLCGDLPGEVATAELFDSLFCKQQSSDATQEDQATSMSQEEASPTSEDQDVPTSQDHTTHISQDCSISSTAVAHELTTTSLLDDVVKQMEQLANQGSYQIDDESTELSGSNWIHLIDSGGQPEFHNLLPSSSTTPHCPASV